MPQMMMARQRIVRVWYRNGNIEMNRISGNSFVMISRETSLQSMRLL